MLENSILLCLGIVPKNLIILYISFGSHIFCERILVCGYRGSVNKESPSERSLLPQYQSNDIKNCPVLWPICSKIHQALIGHSFPWIRDIFCKNPFQKSSKTNETMSKISLVFLPKHHDNHMYSSILYSWEYGIPLNRLFIRGERPADPPKRIVHAKACRSHCRKDM